jgi:hypothetical protein
MRLSPAKRIQYGKVALLWTRGKTISEISDEMGAQFAFKSVGLLYVETEKSKVESRQLTP